MLGRPECDGQDPKDAQPALTVKKLEAEPGQNPAAPLLPDHLHLEAIATPPTQGMGRSGYARRAATSDSGEFAPCQRADAAENHGLVQSTAQAQTTR